MASRNVYDDSVTLFSPAGQIYQVQYATQAMTMGSAVVGVRSNTVAVLASLKRRTHVLSDAQEKLFRVSENIGMGVAGMSADGRMLLESLRDAAENHIFVYGGQPAVGRLVKDLSADLHAHTCDGSLRPYGVGIIVAGCDRGGPHLWVMEPSANYVEVHAAALGARIHSANAKLNERLDILAEADADALVRIAVNALRACTETPVSAATLQIGVVGPDRPWELLDDATVTRFVEESARD